MRKPTTDELIADVLAIHFEVQRHLQDKRRRVTPLQVKVLTDAVASLHRFLKAWQTQNESTRKPPSPHYH
jgi:hypothetical protein